MIEGLQAYAPVDLAQQRLRAHFLGRAEARRRQDRPSHLTASAVVLDASRRHVLLVLHAKVGLWLQPGGHLEDGDATLAAGARREAVEETGVDDLRLLSQVPVHLDRHPGPCGGEHLDSCFVLVARDGAVPTVSEESLDVRWFPVDALPQQEGVSLEGHVLAALKGPSDEDVS